MKKLLLILTFIAYYAFCYSQELIELKFDPVKKEFDKKTESVKVKSGVSYKVKITGLNTSVFDYGIKIKSYTLTSPVPDILKPFLPDISKILRLDSTKFSMLGEVVETAFGLNLNRLYAESKVKYDKLCQLKIVSDSLYEHTKSKININEAYAALNDIKKIFEANSLNEIKRQVILFSKYIILAQEIYKNEIGKKPNDEMIINYNELSCIYDTIKTKNYLLYVTFIENSLKAKDYIESRPFKAEKDIIDLNLTFVDNYVKDTVYKSSLSFYIRGNLSFDFSTGFFYNNLHENSYYLEKRDTLKNNVFIEKCSTSDISFGALGHFSYKFLNWFKAGLSMGAALSPFDGKTRYLLGGSLIFGRKNELGINGGLVLAKLKVLSNSVKNDEKGNYVPVSITSVPTYEKIKSGFYIGLTYNITSTKK